MSLILQLRTAENLKGRSERVAKATFRGVSQFTKICDSTDNAVCFDEVLKWNLPDLLEPQEQISIEVYNYNKYLANRLVGTFGMVLQQLVVAGKLQVDDCLLDENNIVTQANITFELTYNPPDPRVIQLIDDVTNNNSETKALLSPISGSREKLKHPAHPYSDPEVPSLRSQRLQMGRGQINPAFKSVRTIGRMMKFVKQTRRHAAFSAANAAMTAASAGNGLIQSRINDQDLKFGGANATTPAYDVDDDNYADDDDDDGGFSNYGNVCNPDLKISDDAHHSSQMEDYQVSVTIIEARQLSGVNMNPVVCVQVGDQRKYTSVKESTNCPYFNEYFVFDFHIIASVLLDKMITISVLHSRNILRSGTKIGSFKLDVGTVYDAPDHHFYHKWAVLTDPDDATGGCKGYVKCDIAVFGKGDKIKVPQKKSNADDDDIESNLLLPNNSPVERQRARFVVAIYRGEGFPRMNTGIMANVKKAITGEVKDLVDPYVQVSFAGKKGRTSTKKGRYNPVWNEEVAFTEMFPPFCCRVKLQVRNDDVNDDVIATHFLDLASISNDGMNGFLPTFGPSWVNLYGSFRPYNIVDEYAHLNEGIAAGFAYRGRILISFRVELVELGVDVVSSGPPGSAAGGYGATVDVGPCLPVPESYLGSLEEYFLFASIFSANMIDKKLADKPISFEISIGNYGNVLDGPCPVSSSSTSSSSSSSLQPPPPSSSSLPTLPLSDRELTSSKTRKSLVTCSPETKEAAQVESDPDCDHDRKPLLGMTEDKDGGKKDGGKKNGGGNVVGCGFGGSSMTEGIVPVTKDKYYYSMPQFDSDKPCVHTRGLFEDHKFRLYNTNLIQNLITLIETGSNDINEMLKMKTGNPERKLKYLLETVSQSCSRYLTLISTKVVATTMKTRLDRERLKMCRGQVENVASVIRLLRPTINQANVKDKLKIVHNMLMRLKKVRSDPQHSLPDVFIWMVQNKKRIAYHRLTASSLIYSTLDDEKGANCGRLQTLVMKTPQKKGSSCWTTQARLSVYLWLGAAKHRKKVFEGLPSGYQPSSLIRNIAKADSKPPSIIKYTDSHNYQLRAYMYQARGLIGSDDTGLSDPFARVIFGHESLVTRVIDETLNPSWDEMLIFRDVRIFSSFDDVMKMPPEVVVEIFDRDRVGKSEFIGHSVAYPVVKGYRQKYEPPKFPAKLCWHDVYRGAERAGELLAAFELLQLAPHGESSCDDLPPCDLPIVLDPSRSSSMPVPRGIRPTLSTHRIEVLFWGVRDMKRVQFMAVEKPRVDVECSGKIISSSIIRSCRRNPNFSAPIKYVDVDLPDNDLYCPPITIRCFDCRNFGRFVLVGNHVIDNIRTFIYSPAIKNDVTQKEMLSDSSCSPPTNYSLPSRTNETTTVATATITSSSMTSPAFRGTSDVLVLLEDEKLPLIAKHESIVTIETGKPTHETKKLKDSDAKQTSSSSSSSATKTFKKPQQQQQPQQSSSKRKRSSTQSSDDETELEGLDWWTKYHASVLCRDESEATIGQDNQQLSSPNQSHSSDANKINQSLLSNGKLESNYLAINSNNHNIGSNISYYAATTNATTTTALATTNATKLTSNNYLEITGCHSFLTPDKTNTAANAATSPTSVCKSTSLKLSKAANLVAKLSPKSQRRKEEKKINWAKLKIYHSDLESEFNGFKEWLHTYDLYRGKKTNDADDDDSRVVGKFKGAIVIYKHPLPNDIEEGLIDIGGNLKIYRTNQTTATSPPPPPQQQQQSSATTTTKTLINNNNNNAVMPETGNGSNFEDGGAPSNSLFQCLPSNEPLHVLVRVYVVKAIDLHPADINGKADPYIVIKLGQTTINDKENYISKQLNPVFGKCFEVEAIFPQDSLLRVQVYDWDLIGADDIIGETVIDLENRYFSRHRATCGLALQYDAEGYNAWRDPMKPTAILSKLCKDYKLDGPYYQPGRVRISNMVFNVPAVFENEKGVKTKSSDESLALTVLHNWEKMPKVGCKLVAEHVEKRALYHPDKPGMEQGKLEMWVDMFPIDMPAPGPPVDISPRKPKSYELRVIIWNTDDVVLEDDAFFTGEKMSDIYVKGWIKGTEDMQSTDIHYRSLTGEGNFNWRFIFPFEYLVAEEKVVMSRKDTVFSWDETETKIPARLNLQVWDADHFSADDFLGAMTFELTQFPRGAKSSKQCTLDMLKTDGSVPQINLFKHKRVKGWWPFYVKVSGEEMELTGKVEAELHLLTSEEAEKHPAGQGRSEPDPLEKPNRPDTSFVWFLNPIKSLKYILWHNYRWLVLKVLVIILLSLLFILFFYSLPGYTVKKMLGA